MDCYSNEKVRILSAKVKEGCSLIEELINEVGKVIVGQQEMILRMIIALLCDGHILLEGVPGLAKTTAVKTLAACLNTSFQRIQFTPDLLPADILGTQIYLPVDGSFKMRKGPIFHNIILVDEINRAPAKVQSALLEAMQEKQVTIGEKTFKLKDPFLVMATQNPIEQEGTYPLPEAQVDRFMLKIRVDYPSPDEEKEIMKRIYRGINGDIRGIISEPDLISLRGIVREIHIEECIFDYIVDICRATRSPVDFHLDLDPMIAYGASPRASIYLGMASQAHAFLNGRTYVTPHDVKSMAHDVLRHRIIVSYEAEAEEITSDQIISEILSKIKVP